MSHPYHDLPARAFWRSAVAEADRALFPGLYVPKVKVNHATRIATAGSCFAQHIGTYLRLAGCDVLDTEPAPKGMTEDTARTFGYGLYSARYGNIYTARQLRQLLEEVLAAKPETCEVWTKGARFVDALRPTIEPEGLGSSAEVRAHRAQHLARVAPMLLEADVFVFTLGLTECWADQATGRVYPVCPGVAGGDFDPARHEFVNFTHAEVLDDLETIMGLLRQFNPDMQLLLTLSPVPLTATAGPNHVLAATTYSKSVLRAAIGQFVAQTPGADYFPSYEIITAPASGGPWFESNMRAVRTEGVEKVMVIFFQAHGLLEEAVGDAEAKATTVPDDLDDDLICEDLLLQAFAK